MKRSRKSVGLDVHQATTVTTVREESVRVVDCIPPWTVRKLVKNGDGPPSVKVAGRSRFRRAASVHGLSDCSRNSKPKGPTSRADCDRLELTGNDTPVMNTCGAG